MAEIGRKLKVEATYTFDASAKNTCDGLGGLATFLGAHGAATVLPQPFATMARGATAAAFSGNLSSLKVTNAVTGKLVAGADIAGLGKVGTELGGEAGVTVGMEKVERTDEATKKKVKDTVLSATLYLTASGKGATELVPGGLPLFKGEVSGTATNEASISYNLGTDKVDAGLKQTLAAGYSLAGFGGLMTSLPGGARAAINRVLAQHGIAPDSHEGEEGKSYTLADLGYERGDLQRTASHFHWGGYRGFDEDGRFRLEMVDGLTILFDVATGERVEEGGESDGGRE
jgi:hypothetical protein